MQHGPFCQAAKGSQTISVFNGTITSAMYWANSSFMLSLILLRTFWKSQDTIEHREPTGSRIEIASIYHQQQLFYPKNVIRRIHLHLYTTNLPPLASCSNSRRISRHCQVPKQSKRVTSNTKLQVHLVRLCHSLTRELQFNINSTVKRSWYWCLVETDKGPLDTDNHSQLRIAVTVVFNILYKTQTATIKRLRKRWLSS